MSKFPEGFTPMTANDVYGKLFYQFPKVFIHGNSYKSLKMNHCMAYVLLCERKKISVKNNWVDEEGYVYFNYSDKELAELLHVSERTVRTIKNELSSVGLLAVIQQGKFSSGTTIKSIPSRLYLGELQLSATDVYLINKHEEELSIMDGKIAENPVKSMAGKNCQTEKETKPSKINDWQNLPDGETQQNQRLANFADELRLRLQDNTSDTTIIQGKSFPQAEKKFVVENSGIENEMKQNFGRLIAPIYFEPKTLDYLATCSPDIAFAREAVNTIHKAKRAVERERSKCNPTQQPSEYRLLVDDYKDELHLFVQRFLSKVKIANAKEKPMNNQFAYLFSAARNFFETVLLLERGDFFESTQDKHFYELENEVREFKKFYCNGKKETIRQLVYSSSAYMSLRKRQVEAEYEFGDRELPF
jgi:hypothetical protein